MLDPAVHVASSLPVFRHQCHLSPFWAAQLTAQVPASLACKMLTHAEWLCWNNSHCFVVALCAGMQHLMCWLSWTSTFSSNKQKSRSLAILSCLSSCNQADIERGGVSLSNDIVLRLRGTAQLSDLPLESPLIREGC